MRCFYEIKKFDVVFQNKQKNDVGGGYVRWHWAT